MRILKNSLKFIFIQFSVFEPLAKVGFSDNWRWQSSWSLGYFILSSFVLLVSISLLCCSAPCRPWGLYLSHWPLFQGQPHFRNYVFSVIGQFSFIPPQSIYLSSWNSLWSQYESHAWKQDTTEEKESSCSSLQETHLKTHIFICTWF